MDQPGLSPSNQFSVTNLIIKLHSKFEIINRKVDGRERKCNWDVSNAPEGQFSSKNDLVSIYKTFCTFLEMIL